jgi:hypothetical protein
MKYNMKTNIKILSVLLLLLLCNVAVLAEDIALEEPIARPGIRNDTPIDYSNETVKPLYGPKELMGVIGAGVYAGMPYTILKNVTRKTDGNTRTDTIIQIYGETYVLEDRFVSYETFNQTYWDNEVARLYEERHNQTVEVTADITTNSTAQQKNWTPNLESGILILAIIIGLGAIAFAGRLIYKQNQPKVQKPEDIVKALLEQGYDERYVEEIYAQLKAKEK